MSLPAPNLDDRRFQDLVDEAKRMVQSRWPQWTGWTDHNVSDPGVTLIETVASMVDQLLYRLNRLPDRTYVQLLELVGLTLHPPTAAQVPVTFWLTSPQATTVFVPAGTEVATERSETREAVVFHTMRDLRIVTCHLAAVGAVPAGAAYADLTDPLGAGQEVLVFSPRPAVGDAFYVGLSDAVPSCTVALRMFGRVEGYGIDPDRPPRRWEAYDGTGWVPCEIERDETGGFNRSGVVVLHVPATHTLTSIGTQQAGWLRCVVTEPPAGGESYAASPRIERMEAFTVAGTIDAIHSALVEWEVVGTGEGTPGQQLWLRHAPVVAAPDPEVIDEIPPAAEPGTPEAPTSVQWVRVDSFAGHDPEDRVFTIDSATGRIDFPPAVRERDGTVRHFGAVPGAGNELRIRAYRTGGGRAGNVAAHAIRHLRTALPGISAVDNRADALGGVDAERLDEAKLRGPLMLRTRDRAVTAGDFEHLTREAAPEVARVICRDVSATEPGVVRVLVVPEVDTDASDSGRIRFDQLRPTAETLERIAEYLEARRIVGVRVVIETPQYQGITVSATLRSRRNAAPDEVQARAERALYRYYHPIIGGPDGTGWPFGRPVQAGEVHAILQRVPGVDFVEESELYVYDLEAGVRDETNRERIDLPPTALVLSVGHDVEVRPTL